MDTTLKDDNADPSGLSPEQADTDRLLRQLLGTAIADRYADFCRLASGKLPLTVSRPLAGHALRELDSLIRQVLAVPMEAIAVDNDEQAKLRRQARRMLKKMGFPDRAVQHAGDALKPTISHRTQIEKIVERLGLAPDGDIATLWIELNDAYGRAHERSFHERLEVDETFRAQYAKRFETVVRALAVQLQGRYAALMRRAKEIAGMPPADGITLFVREIPGAPQLHSYFYDNLSSDEWLPFLEKAGLLKEPLPNTQAGEGLRIWTWPVGRYLFRMASSDNATTRKIVARALRALSSSANPDVQRLGLDSIAALPAEEAATLIDVVSGWLTPETAHFQPAPHKLIAMLAQAGQAAAALSVAEATFQVFDRGGELATFFDTTMYEHYMMGAVTHLAKADPFMAIPRFSNLLIHASRLDRRLRDVQEENYSYYSVESLQPDQRSSGDVLATIIHAITKFATSAVEENPASVRRVLDLLSSYKPRIFRRIALHTLALVPAEAPDVADRYLTDPELIDGDWCRQEYAELARAWLNQLSPDRQKVIFDFIDSVPAAHLDTWHDRLQWYEKRQANAEDDRRFRETTIRDIVWMWRDALPLDRRAALDKTVAEFGDPDAWRNTFLARDQSPLTRASMQSQPIEETVVYLETWRPDPQLQIHTAGGLANELREAAVAKPDVFSMGAKTFGRLRPLFIRHLLDGLRQSTANGAKVDWSQCLELINCILARSKSLPETPAAIPGDDSDWSWTLRSAAEWLAAALRRGADGVPFVHAAAVRTAVIGLYCRSVSSIATTEDARADRKRPYFAALQTVRGAAIDLCVWLLFWESKNPTSEIGRTPENALGLAEDIRAIFEVELKDRSPSSWISRAVLGRYLTWLFFFGKDWVRSQVTNLFPPDNKELGSIAWLGHLQDDQAPVGELIVALNPFYVEHIASLGSNDASPGYKESNNRLVDYLMILYLREQLPENLLQRFWDSAPVDQLRRAMGFIGRHMVSSNDLRMRAMSYWDRRVEFAIHASELEPYRKELGIISTFFLWGVDPLWLMDQLLVTLNAGLGPNDAMGVIDNLAKQLPNNIDKVVEMTKLLVKQPKVEAWIFASEGQSLRKILLEGKKSASPLTVAAVKEIVSYLSSRGNPTFLDIDE